MRNRRFDNPEIIDYLMNQDDAPRRAAMGEHLANDERLTGEVEEWGRLISAIRSDAAGRRAAQARCSERVMRRIRNAQYRHKPERVQSAWAWHRLFQPALAAAVVLCLILIGTLVSWDQTSTQHSTIAYESEQSPTTVANVTDQTASKNSTANPLPARPVAREDKVIDAGVYGSLAAAINEADVGDRLVLPSGQIKETLRIEKNLRLTAADGPVRIGNM